jgi:poly(A) polymerase
MIKLPSLANEPWLKESGLSRVFEAISAKGGDARIAGGAVRNSLFGEPVADLDIATTLLPDEIMEAGTAAGLGVHPTGIDHGTVTLTCEGKPYEVTTLRIDSETFGRRARVEFTSNWEADARRRDFTVNALYCDRHGKIHDFVDGYRDILKKRIRFIDDPEARIKEDYLRILRFFRFHAHYGTGGPDRAGLAACVKLRRGLDHLSAERIRQELFKLLVAPRAVPTLRVMAKTGVLEHILPFTDQFAVLARMVKIDARQSLVPDALVRLMVIATEAERLKTRLKLSNEEGKRIAGMMTGPAPTPRLRGQERRAILYQVGKQAWRDCVRLAWARSGAKSDDRNWRELLQLPERWPIPVLPVHGRDLMRRGHAAGPEIGELLRRIEDWWIASDFRPDKNELLAKFASQEGKHG